MFLKNIEIAGICIERAGFGESGRDDRAGFQVLEPNGHCRPKFVDEDEMIARYEQQTPCDQLDEIRRRLLALRVSITDRPFGYADTLNLARTELLKVAHEYGKRVCSLIRNVLRPTVMGEFGYSSAKSEICLIVEKIGVVVGTLEAQVCGYSFSDFGLNLVKQLRVQSAYLELMMAGVKSLELSEKDYNLYEYEFTDPEYGVSVLETIRNDVPCQCDSGEPWMDNIDVEHVKQNILKAIPVFESNLGLLQALVEPNQLTQSRANGQEKSGLVMVHAEIGQLEKGKSRLEPISADPSSDRDCEQDIREVVEKSGYAESPESTFERHDEIVAQSAVTDETQKIVTNAQDCRKTEARHDSLMTDGSLSDRAAEAQSTKSAKNKKRVFECTGQKRENYLLICAYLEDYSAPHAEIYKILFEGAETLGKRTVSVYCSNLKSEGYLKHDKKTGKWTTTSHLIDAAKEKEARLWELSRIKAKDLINSATSSKRVVVAGGASDS